MVKKVILYAFLFLGIILIGGGVWLIFNPLQPKLTIPEDNPLIYEKLDFPMKGESRYLYIYSDGSIIYVEEKGLRIFTSEQPPTRTWNTGKLTPPQFDSLVYYVVNSGLKDMNQNYQFPGEPIAGGGTKMGDMVFTLNVNIGNFSKTVTASGYLSLDNGATYPDMPTPLNEIYRRLKALTVTTGKVYQENISR